MKQIIVLLFIILLAVYIGGTLIYGDGSDSKPSIKSSADSIIKEATDNISNSISSN